MTPRGIRAPASAKRSGSVRKATVSRSSSTASSTPATSAKRVREGATLLVDRILPWLEMLDIESPPPAAPRRKRISTISITRSTSGAPNRATWVHTPDEDPLAAVPGTSGGVPLTSVITTWRARATASRPVRPETSLVAPGVPAFATAGVGRYWAVRMVPDLVTAPTQPWEMSVTSETTPFAAASCDRWMTLVEVTSPPVAPSAFSRSCGGVGAGVAGVVPGAVAGCALPWDVVRGAIPRAALRWPGRAPRWAQAGRPPRPNRRSTGGDGRSACEWPAEYRRGSRVPRPMWPVSHRGPRSP